MFNNEDSLKVLRHNNHIEVFRLIGKEGLVVTLADLADEKILYKLVKVFIESDSTFFAVIYDEIDKAEWVVDLMKDNYGNLKITTKNIHILKIDLSKPIDFHLADLLAGSLLDFLEKFQCMYKLIKQV